MNRAKARKLQISYSMRNARLKNLSEKGANLLNLVPGAGLEPARTLPGPRDFKSRVSTYSTIRALNKINSLQRPSFQPLFRLNGVTVERTDYSLP